ncbi:MAG: hypothetical protein SOU19_00885 [Candidatus Caccosoma sp.]|nr:hypothetical protein [Candidatus Caccosoma sp.]
MDKEDYKRQLAIANSLYEMGLDMELIKKITTVSKKDLFDYKEDLENKDVDNKNSKDI